LPRTGDHTKHSRLFLAGPGIEAAPIAREGNVVDIAPTLLSLLGVAAPSTYDGRALDLNPRTAPLAQPAP